MPAPLIERLFELNFPTDSRIRRIDRDFHIRVLAERQEDLARIQAAQLLVQTRHASEHLHSLGEHTAQHAATNALLGRVTNNLSRIADTAQAMHEQLASIAGGLGELNRSVDDVADGIAGLHDM